MFLPCFINGKFRTPDISPRKMVERFGFILPGCEPKPVRFFDFSIVAIGAPALEAIDEEPLRVAIAARREPPLVCLFRLPGCEPKPVRFLIFLSRAGKGMLVPYALIFPTIRALAGSASPAW
jgi:hypothetical protein